MKYLIVARHGQYGNDDRLDNVGRNQVSDLAKEIKNLQGMSRVIILSSTAARAFESAEILAKQLDAPLETHEILNTDISDYDPIGVLGLVRSKRNGTDTIVLVTHLEYVEYLPKYFAREELQVELPSHIIGYGKAWVIDCERKTLTRF